MFRTLISTFAVLAPLAATPSLAQDYPARAVKSIHPDQLRRAFFQERSGRWMFDSAGGVVGDLRRGFLQRLRAEGKEVRGDNGIRQPRRRGQRHAFGDEFTQAFLPRVGVMPEQL